MAITKRSMAATLKEYQRAFALACLQFGTLSVDGSCGGFECYVRLRFASGARDRIAAATDVVVNVSGLHHDCRPTVIDPRSYVWTRNFWQQYTRRTHRDGAN